MVVAATGFLALLVLQRLDQRATVTVTALKLDGGVGDMELMFKGMFNPVQQAAASILVTFCDLDMHRQSSNVRAD